MFLIVYQLGGEIKILGSRPVSHASFRERKNMMKKTDTVRMTVSAMLLALGLLLPFLTANNRALGNMLSLMHIPVLLCGFICGWPWGLAVGLITPLLRSLIIGMPPMVPAALAMAAELAAYGAIAGILYKKLARGIPGILVSLIAAMLVGRAVWGIASFVIFSFMGTPFTFNAFLMAAFVTPWPGIVLHLILIPAILIALERAKFIPLKT